MARPGQVNEQQQRNGKRTHAAIRTPMLLTHLHNPLTHTPHHTATHSHPSVTDFDLSSLELLSCGGAPLNRATTEKALAVFGCEFFLSYGMTESCGKISMSLLHNVGPIKSLASYSSL